jgi:hypothetical protein
MTRPMAREQLAEIAELFGQYAEAAMVQAASDYDDDIWFDCEAPFFDDEIDGDEFERRQDEVDARWVKEFEARSRQAIAEALASEELQELLNDADENTVEPDLAEAVGEVHKVASSG